MLTQREADQLDRWLWRTPDDDAPDVTEDDTDWTTEPDKQEDD